MFYKSNIIEIQKGKEKASIEYAKKIKENFHKDHMEFCEKVREEMEKCIEPNKREFLLSLPYTLLESYKIDLKDFLIYMESFNIGFGIERNNKVLAGCLFHFNIKGEL